MKKKLPVILILLVVILGLVTVLLYKKQTSALDSLKEIPQTYFLPDYSYIDKQKLQDSHDVFVQLTKQLGVLKQRVGNYDQYQNWADCLLYGTSGTYCKKLPIIGSENYTKPFVDTHFSQTDIENFKKIVSFLPKYRLISQNSYIHFGENDKNISYGSLLQFVRTLPVISLYQLQNNNEDTAIQVQLDSYNFGKTLLFGENQSLIGALAGEIIVKTSLKTIEYILQNKSLTSQVNEKIKAELFTKIDDQRIWNNIMKIQYADQQNIRSGFLNMTKTSEYDPLQTVRIGDNIMYLWTEGNYEELSKLENVIQTSVFEGNKIGKTLLDPIIHDSWKKQFEQITSIDTNRQRTLDMIR